MTSDNNDQAGSLRKIMAEVVTPRPLDCESIEIHIGDPLALKGGFQKCSGGTMYVTSASPVAVVNEFHHAFELPSAYGVPTHIAPERQHLRVNLIQEELSELSAAYARNDLTGVADALGDLLYVVAGTAVEHGLDLDGIFMEIHRSNMSKVGGHKDSSGKWIKPDSYSPPDLRRFVNGPITDREPATGGAEHD